MRLFIAIELPADTQQALGAFQVQLRAALSTQHLHITWVTPELIHLTLRFFADVPEDRVGSLQECLDAASEQLVPCTAEVAGLGVFPAAGSPRVIWLGIADAQARVFEGVAQRLAAILDQQGWPAEERPFHPHLTLGRIKSPVHRSALLEAMTRCPVPSGLAFAVDRLTLMQSRLTPRGPYYTPLYRAMPRTHT